MIWPSCIYTFFFSIRYLLFSVLFFTTVFYVSIYFICIVSGIFKLLHPHSQSLLCSAWQFGGNKVVLLLKLSQRFQLPLIQREFKNQLLFATLPFVPNKRVKNNTQSKKCFNHCWRNLHAIASWSPLSPQRALPQNHWIRKSSPTNWFLEESVIYLFSAAPRVCLQSHAAKPGECDVSQ